MKIMAVHAQHFLGAPARPITLRASVVCIAGPNGAGKSSLIEAIRFGLTGQAPRDITLKGDYDQLLTHGAKKGSVSIALEDGNTLVRDIKSGKLTSGANLDEVIEDWLPAVLDATTFARMEERARRSFMFKLLRISMAWPVVKEELERENVEERLIDEISAQIRAGFDNAATYANARVLEARAAWRIVTGQKQYGVNIAEDWSAPGADKPEIEVNTSIQEGKVELARSALHDAQQTLADRRAKRTAYVTAEEQLRGAPAAKALEKEVKKAQDAVTAAEARVAELQALAEAHSGVSVPCPKCQTLLTIDRGTLSEAVAGGAVASPAHLAELAELNQHLPSLRRAVTFEVNRKARIDALRGAMPAVVTERDLEDAQATVVAAQGELQTAEQILRDASADAAEAAEGRRLTAEARTHHLDAQAWTKLEGLMKPDGIPSTLLQRGLKPLNTLLTNFAHEIGWQAPRLGGDFVVRVGDTAYRLLSESEQWRVDALIAAAVAALSKVRLLLLDRFDVLDTEGRNQLLGWLGVAGTLKAKPQKLTEAFGVHVLWLDGSIRAEEVAPADADAETEGAE